MATILNPDYPILASDSSFYQRQINYALAKSTDNFLTTWIRFGQGGGESDRADGYWPDPWAERNWNAAEAARFLRGCYWVYDERRGNTPDDNTNALLEMVRLHGLGELPWWSDLEVFPFSWDAYREHLIESERQTRVRPYIYTGSWVIQRKGDAPEWLKDYKFVLTGYNDEGPSLYGPLAEVITKKNIIGWQQFSAWNRPWVETGGVDRDYIKLAMIGDIRMDEKWVSAQDLMNWIANNAVEKPAPAPEPIPDPPPPPPVGGFALIWPTDYQVVTQPYAANPAYYSRFGLPGHEGIDIRAPMGTNVYAAAAGTVYRIEKVSTGAYGKQIRIQHEHNDIIYKSIYAHLDEVQVNVGDQVGAGRLIGLADNTGNSSGSHLHFTLKREPGWKDPWMPHNIINPTPFFADLFPTPGWQVVVFGNFRTSPEVADNKIDGGLTVGTKVNAIEVQGEWWKVERANVSGDSQDGWFWNPGYKLQAPAQ